MAINPETLDDARIKIVVREAVKGARDAADAEQRIRDAFSSFVLVTALMNKAVGILVTIQPTHRHTTSLVIHCDL